MFREIDDHNEESFDPKDSVFKSISGVMGAITFGGQYDSENPLLKSVIVFTEKITQFVKVGSALDFLPFGRFLMQTQIRKFQKDIAPLNEFTEQSILNHECSSDIEDVADALQKTVSDTPEEERNALGLSENQIKALSQDLFSAGFATTMETFRWALNLLAKFQDKQKKLHQELDTVLRGHDPTFQDRENLPYCEAVLLEVFRFSSLVALSLPHYAICDTEIKNYFVPKGTLVLTNLYGHHYNEKIFLGARKFFPERFLTEKGKLDIDMAQKIMPFSTGKRRCIGENLARQELALLLAQTFRRYHVMPGQDVNIDENDCIPGLTRAPISYKLIFRKRSAGKSGIIL